MTGELTSEQLHQLYICSLILGRKKEQPIYTTKSHVFHIDPRTKRSWIPATQSAVNVSFFYDSTRGLYRIISVEGTKAVINSTITPTMTFTKTSQKFGQWSDVRANTVYGLGFAEESQLNLFIEKFNEVRDEAKKSAQNGNTSATPVTSASASPITQRSNVNKQANSVHPPVIETDVDNNIPNSDVNNTGSPAMLKPSVVHSRSQSLSGTNESPSKKTLEKPSGTVSPAPADQQLKYENERLKLALAQSSANAKKWEVELATLKSNNTRLTAALQESTSNVEEWKRQLHTYKEENQRLKLKHGDPDLSKDGNVKELRSKVESLENELKRREEEVQRLTRSLNDSSKPDDRIKSLQGENQELRSGLHKSQQQLETAISTNNSQQKVLESISRQLGERVIDLQVIHKELETVVKT